MTNTADPKNSTTVRANNATIGGGAGADARVEGATKARKDRKRAAAGAPLAVQATRVGMRLLSSHAPALAARWAERLFMTPRRHARPYWEAEALESATVSRIAYDGSWLPTWSWSPAPRSWNDLVSDAKTVILVHGWEGRGSQLAAFVPALLARGFRVVTFDAPGHGDSTASLGSVVEHARALHAVAREHGPVHAVVGHSVGGAAALLATRFGLEVERLALVAPPMTPADFAATFSRYLGIGDAVKARMIARIEDRYAMPFDQIDARLDAKRLTKPLFVVHDESDPVVPFAEGKTLAELGGGELLATQGLGHRAILRAPEVIEAVAAFLGEAPVSRPLGETIDRELFARRERATPRG